MNEREDECAIISIPGEYKGCLYCTCWEGDVEDPRSKTVGTYGRCIVYGEETLSLNVGICDYFFNPAYARILNDMYEKQKEDFNMAVKLTAKDDWQKAEWYFKDIADCEAFKYVFKNHWCKVKDFGN